MRRKGYVVYLKSGNAKMDCATDADCRTFYLRFGRAFSDDWMSRADCDTVPACGGICGIWKNPAPSQMGRTNRRLGENQHDGWEPAPVMMGRKKPCPTGKRAGRNSAGGSTPRASAGMGVPAEYLYTSHTSAVEWMDKTNGAEPLRGRGGLPHGRSIAN